MSLSARLNRRITLQVQGNGRDEAGGPLPGDWSNVIADSDGKLWAEVRDVRGDEFIAAGATQNLVQTTITIRYRAGVLPNMRALHGADIYNIEAVLGQDCRTLYLMCSKGVS